MCFSSFLKKCAYCLMLAGMGAWLTGCGEQSSTPTGKPRPQSGTTTGKGPEVPEAASATDEADMKSEDEQADGDKPADDKSADDEADSE